MHDASFGLQQTMQCLKANALRTAAHCLVQVGESPDASKSANDIAECPLSNSFFIVGLSLTMSEKIVPMPTMVIIFWTMTFSPSAFFT
jgi:hypothetical protein